MPPLAISPNLAASSTTSYAAALNLLGPVAGLSLVSLVGELERQGTRADPMVEAAVYQAWIDANATSDLLFAAWFNMGSALARVGDKGNALTAYRNAIVLNPHFHPAEQMLNRLAG